MATILAYATIKSYQKLQPKVADFSFGKQKNPRRKRRSISELVIPSIASASVIPGAEFEDATDEKQPHRYELYDEKEFFEPSEQHPALYAQDMIPSPSRLAPPPPVMLGLTFCESPLAPPSELEGDSSYFGNSRQYEMEEDSPVYRLSQAFAQAEEEGFYEPASPSPLHVRKRSMSPLPAVDEEPDMTYSSDENEEYGERNQRRVLTYLEVPGSAKELMDFEPPPIPPKSPARRFSAVMN